MRLITQSRAFSALVLLALLGFNAVNAQEKKDAPTVSEGEAKLTKKLENAKTLADKMKVAEEFVKKYPTSPVRGQVAKYTASQIGTAPDDAQKIALAESYSKIFTNADEAVFVAPVLIDSYVRVKRFDEAFKLGADYIAKTPEDVQFRLILASAGVNLVRSGDAKYAAPSREYAVKAVELIEANKKPSDLSDATWKEYQTKWLPNLYQSIAFVDHAEGKKAEAKAGFEKAAALAPSDANNWAMLGFIVNEEYSSTARRYTGTPDGKEKEELLKQVNEQLDKIIEYYARVIAITDGNAAQQNLNSQMRQDLENYYKFRHKSTDGMSALIDKYKTQKAGN